MVEVRGSRLLPPAYSSLISDLSTRTAGYIHSPGGLEIAAIYLPVS